MFDSRAWYARTFAQMSIQRRSVSFKWRKQKRKKQKFELINSKCDVSFCQ